MIRRWKLLILPALVALITAQPAAAYYDDVHYALTYYIARQIGYTPEQAFRVASAAVSVDWSPETEPVQVTQRTENRYLVITALSGVYSHPTAQEPRWRFHAFRNEIVESDVVGGGRNAAVSDAEIRAQRSVLWKDAINLKNLGIFLHFLQDEVPHAQYGTFGGHWPIMSAEIVQRHYHHNLPIGGATDWLSFRPVESNMALVKQTAAVLTAYMSEICPNQKLRPLDEAAARRVIDALRAINPTPTPLTGDGIDVFRRAKGLSAFPGTDWPLDGAVGFFANKLEMSPADVENLDKHLKGTALDPALEKINEALVREGVRADAQLPFETIPGKHKQFTFDKFGRLGDRSEQHAFVLVGTVNVTVSAIGTLSPTPVKVVLKLAKSRPNDEEHKLGEAMVTPSRGSVAFEKVPVGEFIAELYRGDGTRIYNERHSLVTRERNLELTMETGKPTPDENWTIRIYDGKMTMTSTTEKIAEGKENPVGRIREMSMILKRQDDGSIVTYSASGFPRNAGPPGVVRMDRGPVNWPVDSADAPPGYPKSHMTLSLSGEMIAGTFLVRRWVSIFDKTVVEDTWKVEMKLQP